MFRHFFILFVVQLSCLTVTAETANQVLRKRQEENYAYSKPCSTSAVLCMLTRNAFVQFHALPKFKLRKYVTEHCNGDN